MTRPDFPPKNLDHPIKARTLYYSMAFDSDANIQDTSGKTGIIFRKAVSRAIVLEKVSKLVVVVQEILTMADFRDFE